MEIIKTPAGLELAEFNLRDYLHGGMLKEDPFFKSMEAVDWSQFTGKKVLVRACGSDPLPPWSFMLVTSRLMPYVSAVYYGDVNNPLLIYENESD